MKYCSRCGTQLADEAAFCINCGCAVNPAHSTAPAEIVQENKRSAMKTAIKFFMILNTVFMGFMILPLAWCIPMVLSYSKKIKNNQPIGVGFKICTFLFLSRLGGLLMFFDKEK